MYLAICNNTYDKYKRRQILSNLSINFEYFDTVHPLYLLMQNLAECNETYSNYSRGANCYVTSHLGAYHQHFQIKPKISKHGGLVLGKDKGLHDSDYFIEVQATNNALLTTTLIKKVSLFSNLIHIGFFLMIFIDFFKVSDKMLGL